MGSQLQFESSTPLPEQEPPLLPLEDAVVLGKLQTDPEIIVFAAPGVKTGSWLWVLVWCLLILVLVALLAVATWEAKTS